MERQPISKVEYPQHLAVHAAMGISIQAERINESTMQVPEKVPWQNSCLPVHIARFTVSFA